MPAMEPRSVKVELHLPLSTILRVLVTALVVWCLLKVWPDVVFLLLSLLLAVALEPTVAWAERRRVPRGVAILVLAVAVLGAGAAFVAFGLPPLVRQVVAFVAQLPSLRDRVLASLPADSPFAKAVENALSKPDVSPYLGQTLVVGTTTLSGVATSAFVVITTLYLLLEGKRLYAWLLAYVPRSHRARVAETVPEVSRVVTAYVRGQVLTSALFGVFAAIVLSICKVPAVLPLAVLAALCDIVPVVGIVIATIPAALLGLTVSPLTAGIVSVAYVGYHQIEAYVIVPRVYGSTLRLSTLAVLIALLVGSTLQGLLGAILVLPIVAAYPIIERIWLKDYLAADVLRDHRALEHAAETGSNAAVEAVLAGEKHSDEPPSTRRGDDSPDPTKEPR